MTIVKAGGVDNCKRTGGKCSQSRTKYKGSRSDRMKAAEKSTKRVGWIIIERAEVSIEPARVNY